MENRRTEHPEHAHSVADEAYHGPSGAVTAVGYNAVQWKVGIAVGGILGFVAALFMPKTIGRGVKAIEDLVRPRIPIGKSTTLDFAKSHSDKPDIVLQGNLITQSLASTTNWSLRQAHHIGEWAKGWLDNSVAKNIGLTPERVEKGMIGFGAGGLLGMIGSMFTSSAQAYIVNKRAHDQFRRAKQEINDLRDENIALRSRNSEIKAKCDTDLTAPAPIATTIEQPANESEPQPKPTNVIQKELSLIPESRLVASQQAAGSSRCLSS